MFDILQVCGTMTETSLKELVEKTDNYPVDIFIPMKSAEIRHIVKILQANKINVDRFSSHMMRIAETNFKEATLAAIKDVAGEIMKDKELLWNIFLKTYLDNVVKELPDSYRAKQLKNGGLEAELVYEYETKFLKKPFMKVINEFLRLLVGKAGKTGNSLGCDRTESELVGNSQKSYPTGKHSDLSLTCAERANKIPSPKSKGGEEG